MSIQQPATRVGYVYSIYGVDDNGNRVSKCYIGSTSRTLSSRFSKHCCPNNMTKSKILFETFPLTHIKMDMLESINFTDVIELRKLEQQYMDNLGRDNCLNLYCSYLSPERRQQINRIYQHQYFKKNIIKKRGTRVCECGQTITKRNYATHKHSEKHKFQMMCNFIDSITGGVAVNSQSSSTQSNNIA